jgi:protocatechuate 3,4-dioxygenase beta subunit
LTGVVQGPDDAPLAGAQIELSFRAGNSFSSLNAQPAVTDAHGRFELKGLPLNGEFMISVSAKDHGRMQRQVDNESGTNRLALPPFVLKSADQVVAGQVVDDNDKPVAGASVSVSGVDQASGSVTTDKKGAFRLKICEGMAQLNANNNNGMFGNRAVQSGDTNVLLRIGRNTGGGVATQRLKGTVTDADGKPVARALLSVSPSLGGQATPVRSGSNGEYRLTWSAWPGEGPRQVLLARDPAHNQAAAEELTFLTTNLDVQLKPALTIAGRVADTKGAPLPGAQIYASITIGNSTIQFDQTPATSDARGRYEIKCLPPGSAYSIAVSAKGHGNYQQQCPADPATNRVEMAEVVLKTADRIVAGQLMDENDKPVSGVYVSFSGANQPSDNMMTDRQGRFHFKVCEGAINLNSGSQFGFAAASVEAGDTNIVLTLTPQGRQGRMALQGQLLPDLTTVKLAADAAPAGKPVLLCIFDVAKPASRETVQTLERQAALLWQRNITLLGVQSATITDDDFRAWKTANPVVFPVSRVTKKTDETRWATSVPRLPWLILTDGNRNVISEGFSVDDLEVHLKKLRLDTVPDVR